MWVGKGVGNKRVGLRLCQLPCCSVYMVMAAVYIIGRVVKRWASPLPLGKSLGGEDLCLPDSRVAQYSCKRHNSIKVSFPHLCKQNRLDLMPRTCHSTALIVGKKGKKKKGKDPFLGQTLIFHF